MGASASGALPQVFEGRIPVVNTGRDLEVVRKPEELPVLLQLRLELEKIDLCWCLIDLLFPIMIC